MRSSPELEHYGGELEPGDGASHCGALLRHLGERRAHEDTQSLVGGSDRGRHGEKCTSDRRVFSRDKSELINLRTQLASFQIGVDLSLVADQLEIESDFHARIVAAQDRAVTRLHTGARYPPGTTGVYSYMESRGGLWPTSVFFGLQYLLREYVVGPVVTRSGIEEADEFFSQHLGDRSLFNREGWG